MEKADKEQLMRVLEHCGSYRDCKDCEYDWLEDHGLLCTHEMAKNAYALLEEKDEQKRKWLQAIADNQLANAPTDTMDATQHTYYDGVWNGLQMAWDILTKGR